jgi:nitrogen fixation-related uncharacterized protein
MIKHMISQKGSAHAIIIVVLAIALVGALGYIFWQNFMNKQSTDDSNTAQTSIVGKADDKKSEVAQKGTITGKAIYPAGGYPADYRVCALDVADRKEVVCDKEMTVNEYSIEIDAGNYYVVAKGATMEGYYDGFMKSEMTGNLCDVKNNEPLVVSVAAGATVAKIDAGNFYYMPQNC